MTVMCDALVANAGSSDALRCVRWVLPVNCKRSVCGGPGAVS